MPFPRTSQSQHAAPGDIRVWDRFVRLFHWSVVALFILAFVTQDAFDTLHQAAGYGILALVLARILWGFIGSEHARFHNFLASPREVVSFLRASARLKARRYIGHNPAGGAMVIAVLVLLLIITASGILQTLNALSDHVWIEDLHEGAVLVTLGLIGLHLVGVLVASLEHRENLVRALVTGRKHAQPVPDSCPATADNPPNSTEKV